MQLTLSTPLVFYILSTMCLKSQNLSSPEKLRAEDSLSAESWYKKGLALEMVNKPDEALETYDKVLSLDDNFIPAYFKRASLLALYKDKALDDLRTAESIINYSLGSLYEWDTEDDIWSEYFSVKGGIYFVNNDFIQAIDNFRKALDNSTQRYNAPQKCLIKFRLAESLYFNEEYNEALLLLREILEINPDDSNAWLTAGRIYEKNNKYQLAFTMYNNSIGSDSLNYRAFWERGALKQKLGDLVGARNDLSAAIIIERNNSNIFVDRAILNLKLKHFAAAKKDVDRVLKLENNSIRGLQLKSRYYFSLKDRPRQIQVLNEIIDREPFDPSAFLQRGLAKLSIDQDGCPDLRKAGELGALEAFSLIKEYCNE